MVGQAGAIEAEAEGKKPEDLLSMGKCQKGRVIVGIISRKGADCSRVGLVAFGQVVEAEPICRIESQSRGLEVVKEAKAECHSISSTL